MRNTTKFGSFDTIGLDVSDRRTHFCEVRRGVVVAEGDFPTTPKGLSEFLASRVPCRIVTEVGTHSPWMSEILRGTTYEAFFVNPALMMTVNELKRKTDKLDARFLASRGSLSDVNLFESHVVHREREHRAALTTLRAREHLVSARTRAINALRGLVKPFGVRLPTGSASTLLKPETTEQIPREIYWAVEPMLALIRELNELIKRADQGVTKIENEYPRCQVLQQIQGVGPITSTSFLLTLGDPNRFKTGRQVASYLGLTPGIRQSGESRQPLGITKQGDAMVRRNLLQAAHYILGQGKEDSDLQRFGRKLASADPDRKRGIKRAAVAVARKLAVLLFRLLKTGEVYDPLRNAKLLENSRIAQ